MAEKVEHFGTEKKNKEAPNIKKNTSKRKELETSIRAQVAAEQRAHHIVEHLVLQKSADEQYFLQNGNYITPTHYSDIVEERFIAKLCGYPLCPIPLTQVPKQKYKISVKTNRVFDITERKHFCSNQCYKASKYYESQIPTSPVWTRIGEELKQIVLLKSTDNTLSHSSGVGQLLVGSKKVEDIHSEEINSQKVKTRCLQDEIEGSEADQNASTDNNVKHIKAQPCTEKLEDSHITREFNHINVSPLAKVNDSEIPCGRLGNDSKTYCTKSKETLVINKEKSDNKNIEAENEKCCSTSWQTQGKEHVGITAVSKGLNAREILLNSIKDTLSQWFTESTYQYLAVTSARDITGLEDEVEVKKQGNIPNFTSRALSFLQSRKHDNDDYLDDEKNETTNKVLTSQDITIAERNTSVDEGFPCIVPPIDSKSQSTIRRQIVQKKLTQVLPEILNNTKYGVSDITTHFSALVKTFRVDSHNTMFKPLQWKILATTLLYLLFRKLHSSTSLHPSDEDCIAKTLTHLGLTQQDLDEITNSMKCSEAMSITKSSESTSSQQALHPECYSLMEDLD